MPELAPATGQRRAAGHGDIRLRPEVSLHLLGDGGVLFDAASQQVFAANTTATFIWCCLEEGEALPAIARRLQQTFGLSSPEAGGALDTALAAWRAIGLVGDARPRPVARLTVLPEIPLAPAQAGADAYRLLDTRIRLRCATPTLRRRVAVELAPLIDAAPDDGGRTLNLELLLRDGGFVLAAGAVTIARCQARDEVVPMLKGHLNLLALQHSRDAAAIHAAAVSLGARAVLLPADSGTGKSTLTAALAAAGCRVLGDDTIVLAEPGFAARAMPFGICIKRGSWRLLARRFPALMRRPVYRRPDAKVVRYLLPRDGAAWAAPDFRQPVGWIVFPVRVASGPAALRAVPKLDAVARLLRGFYPLGRGIDAARVDRMVAWLDGTACLELRFAELEDAVRQIRGLG